MDAAKPKTMHKTCTLTSRMRMLYNWLNEYFIIRNQRCGAQVARLFSAGIERAAQMNCINGSGVTIK